MQQHSSQLIANPLTVSNGAELLAQTISNWWGDQRSLTIEEVGNVTYFFNEDELANIAAGEFTEFNPTAYLTQPLIKDALTIAVSEDSNTVDITVEGSLTGSRTFTGDGAGNFNASTTTTHADGSIDTDFDNAVATPVVGVDADEILVSRGGTWLGGSWAMQIKVTPVDNNEDGLADNYIVRIIWGDSFNEAGDLLNQDGQVLTFEENSYIAGEFASANHIAASLDWKLAYNPYTVSNALDFYKAHITDAWDSTTNNWIDGIGKVEVNFSDEDLALLVANSTNSFDAYNTEADDDNLFEDKDNFLNATAALTLEAILGDYQVKLQLSGERTALEDGVFDLGMSYQLPGEDKQRSFTVHYNTEEEGTLTANNFEGVVLVLEEPDEDATGVQVIGRILVGPTAIQAAIIEDRDGIIVIVYSDEVVETL